VIADRGESSVITSIMSEQDVETALKHPLVGVGTDSGAQAEDGKLSESKSHPRAWGSFPRILGKYVRDQHLLTLEEAIRKMTSKAADRVHLADRGVLRPGMIADITIFDPTTIHDASTFEDPKHYSVGVKYVVVNGRRAILGDNLGFLIGRRGGRALAERHGPKIGLNGRRLRQFDRYFERHGAKTVFIARFVTGLRVFGAVLAGGSGLPWRKFLFYNATG